jgi:hypothetical protein
MKKKLLIIAIIALAGNAANAQDNAQPEKVRFGIVVSPSMDWYTPSGNFMQKEGKGIVFKVGGGLDMEFRITKVASLATGFLINSYGGKIQYNNGGIITPNATTVSYYYSTENSSIDSWRDAPTSNTSSTQATTWRETNLRYQLDDRTYSVTYITIPLTLKLKTNQMGMMTYFGQIGINNDIRWRAKANDAVNDWTTNSNTTFTKVDITKDVAPIHEAVTFGLGAEWNVSGTTALTFGLNYIYGITNSVKSNSDYLMRQTNSASPTVYNQDGLPQNITSNSIVLTVGILF